MTHMFHTTPLSSVYPTALDEKLMVDQAENLGALACEEMKMTCLADVWRDSFHHAELFAKCIRSSRRPMCCVHVLLL
jgi:hypothetical protein